MKVESYYDCDITVTLMMPQWKIPREFDIDSITFRLTSSTVRIMYNGSLRFKGRTVNRNVSFTEDDLRRYEKIYKERFKA